MFSGGTQYSCDEFDENDCSEEAAMISDIVTISNIIYGNGYETIFI